jgi:hypothetical protein
MTPYGTREACSRSAASIDCAVTFKFELIFGRCVQLGVSTLSGQTAMADTARKTD